MPLDEATRRFSFLVQRELRRMLERHEEHVARGEEVRFDSSSRVATVETRRGDTVARLYAEVLATYAPRDRILRWAWAGRSSSAQATHGDAVFREGQAHGVAQLSMSVVGDLDESDAAALAKLGALVAGAEGLHDRKVGSDIEYLGLFERPRPSPASARPGAQSRFSVPPPPVSERPTLPESVPPPAYRSIPPVREVYEPRTGSRARLRSTPPPATSSEHAALAPGRPKQLREPARALFLPVANAALAALARMSKGYAQALFVVTIDASTKTSRPALIVQLVVIDSAGLLRALDPPTELLDAAFTMVEAERRDGLGWRKLSARITPKPDGGASFQVDVS